MSLKNNTQSLQEVLEILSTKASGGGSDEADSLITMEMSSYTNTRVSKIGNGAFAYAKNLKSVNFPAVTYIGSYAFRACGLVTISFPIASDIGNYAFNGCENLTAVNFPAAKIIGECAFSYCTKLATVSFPIVTTINDYAFHSCSNLTSVNFPATTIIGWGAFNGCSKLATVSLPNIKTINYDAFVNCRSLTSVNFPAATYIWDGAFYRCDKLSSLQLGASSVCILTNSDAFDLTPFEGYSSYFSGTPHIYVPASLISAYQSATNWTYFSSYFSSIESLGPELIEFTIEGTEYQAEEGMTWAEWIDSEYNTGEYCYRVNSSFIYKNDYYIDFILGEKLSDIIQNEAVYQYYDPPVDEF